MKSIENEGRRQVMKVLMGAAACAGAGTMLPARAEDAPKLAKSEVKYVERGPEGMDCDDCRHFVPGRKRGAAGTCRIVAGPISPHGSCAAFAEKA